MPLQPDRAHAIFERVAASWDVGERKRRRRETVGNARGRRGEEGRGHEGGARCREIVTGHEFLARGILSPQKSSGVCIHACVRQARKPANLPSA
ncbi:hypothetical protein PUN28_009558 [Cardiocondyla obscurior]|uniref:Uncharacterized protein n=1 Tax=Cardiocondyla obscurior TaxID=286306 RepID=A0AAW2FW96_9HYME